MSAPLARPSRLARVIWWQTSWMAGRWPHMTRPAPARRP